MSSNQMLSLLAAVADCDRSDAPPLIARLIERFSVDEVREMLFSESSKKGLATEENGPLPLILAGSFITSIAPRISSPLVAGLLEENSLIIYSGPAKAGKSLSVLDMAVSIANGEKVFGKFAVNRPGPVIYLGVEDRDTEIANRLLQRGIKMGDTSCPVYVLPPQPLDLSDQRTLERLRLAIRNLPVPPVCIIIDTARETLNIKQWNDPGEVIPVMALLRLLAREVCSIILITHNRKSKIDEESNSVDLVAGTGAFTSSTDGVVTVTKREKTDSGFRLHLSIAGRGDMHGDAVIAFNAKTHRFSVVTEEEEAMEKEREIQSKRQGGFKPVANLFGSINEPRTAAQIASHLSPRDVTPSDTEIKRAQALVNDAISDKWLIACGNITREKGERGRPAALYRLTPEALDLFVSSQEGANDDSR